MADHAAETVGRWIQDPKVRNYIYKVAYSAGPVVLFYGLMSAQEVALWLGLGGTILGLPSALASANTPTK